MDNKTLHTHGEVVHEPRVPTGTLFTRRCTNPARQRNNHWVPKHLQECFGFKRCFSLSFVTGTYILDRTCYITHRNYFTHKISAPIAQARFTAKKWEGEDFYKLPRYAVVLSEYKQEMEELLKET